MLYIISVFEAGMSDKGIPASKGLFKSKARKNVVVRLQKNYLSLKQKIYKDEFIK